MNDAAKPPDWRDDPDSVSAFLSLLESRRAGVEAAQWQPPTLTIAAQAFLLFVLTDDRIGDDALLWILFAGVTACLAAILSIVRLRARELLYSEAIGYVCAQTAYELPDPRPAFLVQNNMRKPVPLRWWQRPLDRPVRSLGGQSFYPTVYLVWIAALILFIVADIFAYCSST
jgi:hypothetical protein